MGLSRRALGSDEEIIVEVRSHRGSLVAPSCLLLTACAGAIWLVVYATSWPKLGREIAAGVVIGLPLWWLLARWMRWRSRSVSLTNERVVVSNGSLRKKSEQVRLMRIIEVHLIQGVTDRLLRRGDVILEVDDGPPLAVEHLRHPEAFQRVVLRELGRDEEEGDEEEEDDDEAAGAHDLTSPSLSRIQVITEDDPTPPQGTPAVSGSRAATLFARLDELDRLEASGALSPHEAALRRAELSGTP